jgi:CRP/FNR family transcriptional regulator, cyclic AMP receptor protein
MAARTIFLLDEDPDLGDGLDPARRAAARSELIADVIDRDPGVLEPHPGLEDSSGALGLLVLDGLVTRRTSVAGRRGTELLGVGDLLRPWQDDGHHDVAPFDAVYQLLGPARLAVLDRRAATRIGRWPEVMCSLFQRTMSRSRTAVGHLVLAQMPRVDERLHVLFWHLADRWGRVTSEGVVLPLKLSHELLGALIGAQRPTVTLALGALAERGAVIRRPDRTWLLLERPVEDDDDEGTAAE